MIDNKRKKVMNRFITAAVDLIDTAGIENVTIRNVALKTRYNSATLYNYFENLDHLIFFAAMRYVRDYSLSLDEYLKNTANGMDRFLRVWECFCNYSFLQPEVYRAIFFPQLSQDFEHYISQYYSIFPEDLGVHHQTVTSMLKKGNIYDRNLEAILDCVQEGYISVEDANDLNDMTVLLYEGILLQRSRGKIDYETACNNAMRYIRSIVTPMLLKPYPPLVLKHSC